MPASSVDGGGPPTVPLSFSNNFWGRDDAGVEPLLTRMQNAKTTCDELKAFYAARSSLEEDYAKKLHALSRKPLGSVETGSLRAALDVARGETESMAKQHGLIAQQMKSELEEPLGAFAGGMKERRKIVQAGIEKLLKIKQTQTALVNKSRDRYEQDCLRIKGYLAQGHMVMGQEERKNKAKLEKSQINMASNSNEYDAAIKVLEETIGRWNKEWKAACDKFQDLEEERLDFSKSSLWAFANIASTVCVSDDSSCEKVRLALENCEVEKDIVNFIKSQGTGQEIPDPPKYINFSRGDIDSASEVSEDEGYSVAQFSRTTNPAFRSSSPTHSNPPATKSRVDKSREISEEPISAPIEQEEHIPDKSHSNSGKPAPLRYRQAEPNVPPNYSPQQHGQLQQVPHNEYPTEGMTMFCRTGPPSATASNLSSNTRPESRDDQSEYSNPSSFTSAEPMSGKTSPMKDMPPTNGVGLPGMTMESPDKYVQKKRSGFFTNSPFRRKSRVEQENPVTNNPNRNTWNPTPSSVSSRSGFNSSVISSSSTQSTTAKSQTRTPQNLFNRNPTVSSPENEEPADPRASFQLNVGNNVFDVASPDSHESTPRASMANRRSLFSTPTMSTNTNKDGIDPVAQALASLKQSSCGATGIGNKHALGREPVDRYHNVKTPAPDSVPFSRPMTTAEAQNQLATQRGTPPPAYNPPASALGVPQPAFTSKQMKQTSQSWGTSSVASSASRPKAQTSSQVTMRDGRRSPGPGMVPRAASPQPQMQQPIRAKSPAPPQQMRARSPMPDISRPQPPPSQQMRSHSPAPPQSRPTNYNPPQVQPLRARSPAPPMIRRESRQQYPAVRPRSPMVPVARQDGQMQPNIRARSPAPMMARQQSQQAPQPQPLRARSPAPSIMPQNSRPVSQQQVPASNQYRTASPNPPATQRSRGPPQTQSRQTSGMEIQLASHAPPRFDSGSGRSRAGMIPSRPASAYGGDLYQGQQSSESRGRNMEPTIRRERSKSMAQAPVVLAPAGNPMVVAGEPHVLHFAKAMYSYSAAIPEELTFSKGDILAVTRLQDDGWWEAEVRESVKGMVTGRVGLVPSNYLQQC